MGRRQIDNPESYLILLNCTLFIKYISIGKNNYLYISENKNLQAPYNKRLIYFYSERKIIISGPRMPIITPASCAAGRFPYL